VLGISGAGLFASGLTARLFAVLQRLTGVNEGWLRRLAALDVASRRKLIRDTFAPVLKDPWVRWALESPLHLVTAVHGAPPDRINFSYCLSMVGDPRAALARARQQVAPGGSVVVVDFADMADRPGPLRHGLRAWVGAYRVTPLSAALLEDGGARVAYGPLRYYAIARYPG
jgi:hypothetical protein